MSNPEIPKSPLTKKRKPSSSPGTAEIKDLQEATVSSRTSVFIDEDLYSRQLYILGHDGMRRTAQSNVLVSGLGGLGVEIAKNVILGGVKSITLHDNRNCEIQDLSSQFYLTEADIGKNRAEISRPKLADLNKYVHTATCIGNLTEEVLKNFNVVVLSDNVESEREWIAKYTHANGIALVIAETRGLCAKIFCDFGEEYTTYDKNGAPPVSTTIAFITKGAQAVLTCFDENRNGLEDGDYVTFSEVEGMVEINKCDPMKIKLLGPYSFQIGDTSNYSDYIRGGIATRVKVPETLNFKPLQAAVPLENSNHHISLHAAFKALDSFTAQEGRLPIPWNNEDASRILEMAKAVHPVIEEELVLRFAKTCAGQLSPIDTAFGGMAAQEVLKACSGKFTPISQFFYYNALECITEEPSEEDVQPLGCRYDAQIAIFGKNFQATLANLRYFIVGVGAVGCELLKIFAMAGIGVQNGEIIISDMDKIKKSNLNRHCLFRSHDVQNSKALTAMDAVKTINNDINVQAHKLRVVNETEDVFSEQFYQKLDGVVSALDNPKSRCFVDRKCVFNRIPLVNCSTLGIRGNTQVIVPYLTHNYNKHQELKGNPVPICTLSNFPYAIEHTLQWARTKFEVDFTDGPEDALSYISDSSFVQRFLAKFSADLLQIIKPIKATLIDSRPHNFSDCVKWARINWEDNFSSNIKQMLRQFPEDYLTTYGERFWSGNKRRPRELVFNVEDPLNLDFIYAAANLRAEVYGIPQVRDRKTVANIVSQIQVPNTTVKGNAKNENNLNELLAELASIDKTRIRITSIKFDKDDNTNLHMDFIMAASNLRAANYRIPPADIYKSKLIAGKIIPAIATSSSLVAGLAVLEIFKLAQGCRDVKKYKNTSFNLALPLFESTAPTTPVKNTYYDKEWTLWDRFEVQGDMTLTQFLEHFKTEHKLVVTMVARNGTMFYTFCMPANDRLPRLPMKITEIVESVCKERIAAHERSLAFEICCTDDSGKDVDVPYVRYMLP